MTSVGIDTVSIQRIEKFIEKFGQRATSRFLSDEEIALCSKNTASIAGFWAAKEAASKALGVGISKECGFFDIILDKTKKGAPTLTFSQKVLANFNISNASVSITHDGGFAIAAVIVERQ